MDTEQFQGLLSARDVARDAFLVAERELLAAVNGHGTLARAMKVAAEIVDRSKRMVPDLGNAAGIERVRRAVASKAAPPKSEAASKPSGGKSAFNSETGPKILKMLSRGNKSFVEVTREFPDFTSQALHYQIERLRGMNFIDREGEGYAIKPAGREWLNQNGEGK